MNYFSKIFKLLTVFVLTSRSIEKINLFYQADVTESEPEDDEVEEGVLVKNTNASTIHQAEKEKREKAKLENQKKKERDKLER